MKRQNVIIFVAKDKAPECWGNFKKLCLAKGFDRLPYHSLKARNFPIIHKEWIIHKVPFL